MVQGHSESKWVFRHLRSGTKEPASLVVWGGASTSQILGTDRMECMLAFPEHVGNILKRTDAVLCLWMWRSMPLGLVLLGCCVNSSIRHVLYTLLAGVSLTEWPPFVVPIREKWLFPIFEGGHMCLHWQRVGTGRSSGGTIKCLC